MTAIVALLQPVANCLSQVTLRRLARVIVALLALTGRVTMLALARWAGQGGSYRSIQRFFYTTIPWAQLCWQFFRHHLFRPEEVYLLAGDECVVSKAGTKTFGLDRFFSGLLKRPIPGLSFFTLSLVGVSERYSFPLRVEQVVRSEEEKAAGQAKAPSSAPRHKPGRPKGSRNQNKSELPLNPELHRIQQMVQDVLQVSAALVRPTYLVLDGHFGSHTALHMTQQCQLQLISKLRSDSALYYPYEGPYRGRGPHRKYGERVDYRQIPERYCKATTVENDIATRTYQAQLLHHEFSQPLNVVILVKTNLRTGAREHVVLFSSDLALSYDRLVDYYRLRFQIEFNFRDAKQFWGLEDFMNVTQTAVTNAANLALFMTNVAHVLMQPLRRDDPEFSVLDLKARYRAAKYVTETIKMLPQKPEDNLLAFILRQIAGLGSIHQAKTAFHTF